MKDSCSGNLMFRAHRITSFMPFVIIWLCEYCTLPDSSVVGLKSSHPVWNYFPKKIHVLLSNCFPLQIPNVLSSLRESLMFYRCMCSCACANNAEIVRSSDAHCNTEELP